MTHLIQCNGRDFVRQNKTTYVNTLGVQDEVVNAKTVRNSMTVTDDFYYILNAVNGEERKNDNRK